MRHRAPLLWVLAPYAGGVVAARVLANDSAPGLWLALAIVAAAVALLDKNAKRGLWLLVMAACFAGFGRCLETRRRSPSLDGMPAREVRGELRVERLFPRAKAGRVSGIGRIERAALPDEWLGQRMAFTLRSPRGDAPRMGDVFRIYAVAQIIPDNAPPDTFEGYLLASGVNLSTKRGRFLERTEECSWLELVLQRAKVACEQALSLGIEGHPDLVAIYHGLLLGDLSALDPEQKVLFSETGTLHLFSVSGLHIGVVAIALHAVLGWMLPRPRVAVLLPVLGAYVVLTGASPAAMRAFWMVATLELGRAWEQRTNPLSALCVAALISLAFDPLQLFSASFQFSYGIVASLILLGSPMHGRLADRETRLDRRPEIVRSLAHKAALWFQRHLESALTLGLAASLVGEFCTLQYFHLLTPGGLVANLVLIPTSSLAIIAGMISLATAPLGLGFVAAFFNHAAAVVIAMMVALLAPWHALAGTHTEARFHSPAVGFACMAALLILLFVGYARGWQPRRWAKWVPWALAAAALVFGTKFN